VTKPPRFLTSSNRVSVTPSVLRAGVQRLRAAGLQIWHLPAAIWAMGLAPQWPPCLPGQPRCRPAKLGSSKARGGRKRFFFRDRGGAGCWEKAVAAEPVASENVGVRTHVGFPCSSTVQNTQLKPREADLLSESFKWWLRGELLVLQRLQGYSLEPQPRDARPLCATSESFLGGKGRRVRL